MSHLSLYLFLLVGDIFETKLLKHNWYLH